MMKIKRKEIAGWIILLSVAVSCGVPKINSRIPQSRVPEWLSYGTQDSASGGGQNWKSYFKDSLLVSLIDSALIYNQQLNYENLEIQIAQNIVNQRKGDYQPFVKVGINPSTEKASKFSMSGANESQNAIIQGKKNPEPLPNFSSEFQFSWEIDIWRKMRNRRMAAMHQYLGTLEGRNFLKTELVAELANSYYELEALDNQLGILQKNIEILQNALAIIKMEKDAARVSELAVKKFQAEVLKNQSQQFLIQQQIIETENKIKLLTGKYSNTIFRNSKSFGGYMLPVLQLGNTSQLLLNRPDIRKSMQEMKATEFELKSLKAEFYPSLALSAATGLQAFLPQYLSFFPEAFIYGLASEFVGPILNRKSIKSNYLNASARQFQSTYVFDRTLLNAFLEVNNQWSRVNNLTFSYAFKSKQVEALTESIDISTILFKSARADYMEVLMTQRDALDAKFELVDLKKAQLQSGINLYKALGGGWK